LRGWRGGSRRHIWNNFCSLWLIIIYFTFSWKNLLFCLINIAKETMVFFRKIWRKGIGDFAFKDLRKCWTQRQIFSFTQPHSQEFPQFLLDYTNLVCFYRLQVSLITNSHKNQMKVFVSYLFIFPSRNFNLRFLRAEGSLFIKLSLQVNPSKETLESKVSPKNLNPHTDIIPFDRSI
jgi:hypothetical protein